MFDFAIPRTDKRIIDSRLEILSKKRGFEPSAFASSSGVALHDMKWVDARIAYPLLHHGVRQLATRNVKDFEGLGFDRVFDPLVDEGGGGGHGVVQRGLPVPLLNIEPPEEALLIAGEFGDPPVGPGWSAVAREPAVPGDR